MNPTAVRVDDLPVIDTDVLIVGAGPTGLMAGVVLNRRGVPAIVVDRKAGPTRESRALDAGTQAYRADGWFWVMQ